MINRKTKETEVLVKLDVLGKGKSKIKTGINFLDHMLELFAKHGTFDLDLKAKGPIGTHSQTLYPWFNVPKRKRIRLIIRKVKRVADNLYIRT